MTSKEYALPSRLPSGEYSKKAVKDIITGSNRSDVLRGSTSDDYLIDGEGKDKINGGKGSDIYILSPDKINFKPSNLSTAIVLK